MAAVAIGPLSTLLAALDSQVRCVGVRSVVGCCLDVPLRDGAAGGLDLEGGGSCAAQAKLEYTLRSHCCSRRRYRRGFERRCLGRIDVVVHANLPPPTPEVIPAPNHSFPLTQHHFASVLARTRKIFARAQCLFSFTNLVIANAERKR